MLARTIGPQQTRKRSRAGAKVQSTSSATFARKVTTVPGSPAQGASVDDVRAGHAVQVGRRRALRPDQLKSATVLDIFS